jgi:hypothetical protein
LSHEFFKDYSSLNYYLSIRPGIKPGDHTVTNLRVLLYHPLGTVSYKLHHDNEQQFSELPRRGKPKKPVKTMAVPRLYSQQIHIKPAKYTHLQELKKVIPVEFHAFYDSAPLNNLQCIRDWSVHYNFSGTCAL